MTGAVKTTCPYCGVGCGLIVTPDGQGGAQVAGDPDHPANYGRLCSKGAALGETLGLEDRLLHPVAGGAVVTWDTALDAVANAFSEAIRQHGPDSVAIYGSGQLLTEDYYVANKLMKGFIGSANIDTNSRLCMASSVAGHKSAFGADIVPGAYEDLEEADTVVLVGSNLAWCHPVLHQRLQAAKDRRPNMVVVNIDPRRTATSDIADLQLSIRPGGDVALFAGLLAAIERGGFLDNIYLGQFAHDPEPALLAARALDISAVARVTDLSENHVSSFYDIWMRCDRVVTIYSQGVNQSVEGVRKVQAILNCHLATGRIGRPGMGPFSVTGQPNAMGGREVGGLSNMLAAHLDLENAQHRTAVQAFWQAPRIADMPGLKAVDLFEACHDGRIKALWILSTNPAVSMPNANRVREAIRRTPFVAVSEMTGESDTAKLADVLLPATGWGEKAGTVTNSERRISRQRPFLAAPGEARPDWRILSDVASRMGFAESFSYASPADIFREHAALSAIAGDLGRDFDIGGLADISNQDYRDLLPTRWPMPASGRAITRFFANGGFLTDDGRARLHPTPPTPVEQALPFRLNTGRVRDHWHTMTRTAKAPRLNQHMAEPYLEIHPADAAHLNLKPAGLATVSNDQGSVILRVFISNAVRQGEIFAPMHWTRATAGSGHIGVLAHSAVDPISGQPDLKGAPVKIEPYLADWFGFAMALSPMRSRTPYWARAKMQNGWRMELAGSTSPNSWDDFAQALFIASPTAAIISVRDKGLNLTRLAVIEDGALSGVLFTSPEPVEVARAHLASMFAPDVDVAALLAGRPAQDQPDPGATVCSCFSVGVNTIRTAISTQGLVDVAGIGNAIQAGANCGSCRPELQALLAEPQLAAAQ